MKRDTDLLEVVLTLRAGGCVANFTASRVSPTPLRKIRFFQADGYFSIDFLAQSAVILRRRVEGTAAVLPFEPAFFARHGRTAASRLTARASRRARPGRQAHSCGAM